MANLLSLIDCISPKNCHYIAFLGATSIKFGNFIANWAVGRSFSFFPLFIHVHLQLESFDCKKKKKLLSIEIQRIRPDLSIPQRFFALLLSFQPFCMVDLTHFDKSIPIFNQLTVFGRELPRHHLILEMRTDSALYLMSTYKMKR